MELQGLDIDVVRKGSGQPMLLLHGGGGPIAQMPFADRLAEKFDIVAPTHPGVNGSKIPGMGKFGYHAAFMRQAAGVGNASDEKSFALAGYSSFDLGGDLTFEPLAEIVRQIDQGGNAGSDRSFITLAGQFLWKGWNLALSATERYTDNTTTANNTDSHFQVSAGYEFDFGLAVDVGWKVSEDSGTETRTLGILAVYAIEF